MLSTDESPRGLRPNYSCGSLAAAEQLEALMHHPPPSFDGLTQQHQRQLYAAGAALGGMYSELSTTPGAGIDGGGSQTVSCEGCCSNTGRMTFQPEAALTSAPSLDRVDFSARGKESLQQMLLQQSTPDHQLCGQYASGGAFSEPTSSMLASHSLGSLFQGNHAPSSVGGSHAGGAAVGNPGDDGPARSSLSMLHYAGATALSAVSNGGQQHVGAGGLLPLGANQQGVMPSGVAHGGNSNETDQQQLQVLI